MAKETGVEENIPEGYKWDDLTSKSGIELKKFYKESIYKQVTYINYEDLKKWNDVSNKKYDALDDLYRMIEEQYILCE